MRIYGRFKLRQLIKKSCRDDTMVESRKSNGGHNPVGMALFFYHNVIPTGLLIEYLNNYFSTIMPSLRDFEGVGCLIF